jgi:hypothetical protein
MTLLMLFMFERMLFVLFLTCLLFPLQFQSDVDTKARILVAISVVSTFSPSASYQQHIWVSLQILAFSLVATIFALKLKQHLKPRFVAEPHALASSCSSAPHLQPWNNLRTPFKPSDDSMRIQIAPGDGCRGIGLFVSFDLFPLSPLLVLALLPWCRHDWS